MEQLHDEEANYLYERAARRYEEMKAGRYITNDNAMAFIRDYANQTQRIAV